jgi:RNA polymerase sigma factor (sigma-70 family)
VNENEEKVKFIDCSANYYIKSIQNNKHLNNVEQIELVKLAQNGDLKSRDKLLLSNSKFVVNIAREYVNSKYELYDLIQEGNKGLLIAIDKFNTDFNVVFSTYAVYWVRQSILAFIKDNNIIDYKEDLLTEDKINYEENNSEEVKFFIKEVLKKLNKKEKEIIRMNFGLDNSDEMSLSEISSVMGLSNERIRIIKDNAIKKIRSYIVSKSELLNIYYK